MTLKQWTFIFFSAHNAYVMAEIILMKNKKHLNVWKLRNVLESLRATADTLHVHVLSHVLRMDKISFYAHFYNFINSQLFKTVNKMYEIFKKGLSKFIHTISCV